MLKSQIPAKESLLLRFVASIAYMSCLLQWFWAMVLYLPLIRDSNIMDIFINQPSHQPEPVVTQTGSSTWSLIIAIIITILIIALTIYALAKTPGAIRKTGSVITETTAKKYVVPAITQKKKLPQKKLRILTLKVEFIIKLSLVAAAFVISLFAYISPLPLEYNVIVVTSAGLAVLSLLFFTAEFCLKLRRKTAKKA